MKLAHLAGSDFSLSEKHSSLEISGLTANSRAVQPGYLFAALPGTKVDGAKFIPAALEKGAVAVLTTKESVQDLPDSVALLYAPNPRQSLAHMATRFYQTQPENILAVTGTNGKTSVASFVRQIWHQLGHHAASLGTTGLMIDGNTISETLTTPEPVALHKMLSDLTVQNISHLALEASSHGLSQYRLDGVQLKAAAFTNISQDHLDYHKSFEDYFAQKMRLFTELVPDEGAVVINIDDDGGAQVSDTIQNRSCQVITVGKQGETLKLLEVMRQGYAQDLQLLYKGQEYHIRLPLVGDFQVSNALVAAGLCLAIDDEPEQIFKALEYLKGARGRLEHVGQTAHHVPVFVDYAHTPDALEKALLALRPYVQADTGRLSVVFGCGGDRDRGKRPLMGKVAADNADLIYITDDNPRSENPGDIRADILTACPNAFEIADRAKAIKAALLEAKVGDIVVVAGKGHETGQIVGDKVIPFSDHDVVQSVLRD